MSVSILERLLASTSLLLKNIPNKKRKKTISPAAKIIEISGGTVAGFIFVINLFDLGGCDNLVKKNYKVENLIEFPGHWLFVNFWSIKWFFSNHWIK